MRTTQQRSTETSPKPTTSHPDSAQGGALSVAMQLETQAVQNYNLATLVTMYFGKQAANDAVQREFEELSGLLQLVRAWSADIAAQLDVLTVRMVYDAAEIGAHVGMATHDEAGARLDSFYQDVARRYPIRASKFASN